ncbi:hypothetical protein BVF91_07515 [Thermoanaerobacterium sp. PSU-2]|uniref:hypothetical protein n=1 Tax=Thermoanaerobacterium sp. PSU-2 TaxID=1930849 RepID=UPI000A150FB1|nr:hypothetical protein [Thermoanaerobacterium sp. PSU-2]ORX23124.1 hypothetical protein BVF91_07515 [Thermoanaerobacterium sp. PSU-2]
MNIYFSCATSFHIFVSYILAKTLYKDDKNFIFIPNHLSNLVDIYKRLDKIKIWDKVVLIDELSGENMRIENQLIEIMTNYKIDILHYFTWGTKYSRILFNLVKNKKVKIILTDEGIGTYMIKEAYEEWTKSNIIENNTVDLNRIDEIWLFDPDCYVSKLKKTLRKIEFENIISDPNSSVEMCNELNYIFNYNYKKFSSDIIFFDQYIGALDEKNVIDEKIFLNLLFEYIREFKLIVKKHPNESFIKYFGFNVEILDDNDVPWELICFNIIINNGYIDNMILISYFSSAVFNTKMLYKKYTKNIKIALLSKIYRNHFNKEIFDNSFSIDEFIKKFKKKFSKSSIVMPETFKDLKEFIFSNKNKTYFNINLHKNFNYRIKDQLYEQKEKEILFLKSYIDKIKKINRFMKVYYIDKIIASLYVDTGFGYSEKEKFINEIKYDDSFTNFIVNFEINNIEKMIKSFRFDPIENFYSKIKIMNISYIDRNNKLNNINSSLITYNGILQDNGYVLFNTLDPMFNIEVNDYIKLVIIEFNIKILPLNEIHGISNL